MCGIVGITSNKEVTTRIINSLKKLEYRGYDSAGIATLKDGFINEVKCEGRVEVLEIFFSSASTLPSHLTSLIKPSLRVAMPAESYPLYSNFFSELIILVVTSLLLVIPTIPHIYFLL